MSWWQRMAHSLPERRECSEAVWKLRDFINQPVQYPATERELIDAIAQLQPFAIRAILGVATNIRPSIKKAYYRYSYSPGGRGMEDALRGQPAREAFINHSQTAGPGEYGRFHIDYPTDTVRQRAFLQQRRGVITELGFIAHRQSPPHYGCAAPEYRVHEASSDILSQGMKTHLAGVSVRALVMVRKGEDTLEEVGYEPIDKLASRPRETIDFPLADVTDQAIYDAHGEPGVFYHHYVTGIQNLYFAAQL